MRSVVVLLSVLVLAGCGEEPGTGSSGQLTADRVAEVMADHLPEPDARSATRGDVRPSGVGEDFRYGTGGEDDGDLVRVVVEPATGGHLCRQLDTGCEELDSSTTLVWEREVPEEDPGYVAVVVRRGDQQVMVLTAGEPITRDPRELDLTVPLETMVDLAHDDRLAADLGG